MTYEEFCKNSGGGDYWGGGDNCYYPLLYLAMEATTGDIIEMGAGHGSTTPLHAYATSNKRMLYTYETEKSWIEKFENTANEYHEFTLLDRGAWDACSDMHPSPSVVFIDHAPGERRKEDLIRFKDSAQIIVIHDTEPTGAGDYQVRQHFHKFKYCVEIQVCSEGGISTWASALSNTIDITKWIGKFGHYTISEWQK